MLNNSTLGFGHSVRVPEFLLHVDPVCYLDVGLFIHSGDKRSGPLITRLLGGAHYSTS